MADTGPLSAALEGIRAEASVSGPRFADVRRLLAAVDKVLALPEKWAAIDDGPESALTEDRRWVRQDCAADLCETIFRALLGEEAAGE